MSTDIDIDALLAAMRKPGPIDDDPRDYEPDGHSQAELDRRADEAADRYETEMDRRWE